MKGIPVQKRLILTAALIAIAAVAGAQSSEDFAFRVTPAIEVPLGERSSVFNENAPFGLGGSASFSGQYIPPSFPLMYLGGGLNFQFASTPGTAPSLGLASVGMEAGANVRLGNAFSLQPGIEAGWYLGVFGESVGTNPFAGILASFGWDLSPGFSLSAGLGYRYHLAVDGTGEMTDLIQGARISLGTVFRPVRDGERTKVEVANVAFDPVFPVFYGFYDQNSLGSVTVRNGENSTISDVRVYFNVNEYMEQPKLSAVIPSLRRGEEAVVDLNALFRSSVLNINTDTLVQSEIITEYTYLGKTFTRRVPHTLRIHGRNSMTWDDDRKAASFVNPKDPTVLLFSKNTAGLIRETSNNPINLNLRIAMGIFEALRAYGMNYVIDPDSSYIELSEQTNALDTLLFPSEALTYRAGDCDDLSILYSSLLESVGIETAFITIPGHIYMAFNLDLDEDETRAEFTDISDFLFIDGEAWVPVETTMVTENFMRAWRTGARQWRDASTKGTADVWPVHDAWAVYEPAPTQTPPLSLVFPSREVILAGYEQNLQEFVDREVSESLENFQRRIEQRGDSAVIRNRLGVLYARYGLYEEAEEQFQLAVLQDGGYVAPMVNLGNISYLREELGAALSWYQRAERLAPASSSVLAGLARTQYELEQYEEAQEDYNRLAEQDPEAASEYAYIGVESGTVGRAAAAQDRGRTLWEDSGEDPDDDLGDGE